jgi:hypothetical protein
MKALQVIEIFAGLNAQGHPAVEKLPVRELEDGTLELVRSPAFIKGLAHGDIIKFQPQTGQFEIVQHSGNLSVRVFSRGPIEPLAETLNSGLEKLGGELDVDTPRMLVYSIHVSCGFSAIEEILNRAIAQHPDSQWMYGNVYDPQDGQTPLNWWQKVLQPE